MVDLASTPPAQDEIALIVVDLDGVVVGWGRTAEALLGYGSGEMLGAPLSDRLGWEPGLLLRTIATESVVLDGFAALRRKDGSTLPASVTASPLLAGERVAGACLTVLCEPADAMRGSSRRLYEVERMSGVGSWEWSLGDGRTSWSPQLLAIHGLARHDPSPALHSLVAQAHPEDRERLRGVIEQVTSDPRSRDLDYRIIRADGRVRVLHMRMEAVVDASGRPETIVGVVQDITELRGVGDDAQQSPAVAPHSAVERRLNARQLEILSLLAEGLRNAEIAGRLHLSESTIKWHVKRILRTLHVANRAEAAARYVRLRRPDSGSEG